MTNRVYVDCAGASVGGAANFLRELDGVLDQFAPDVEIVGRGLSLSPRWLAKREMKVPSSVHRIALNNVSFVLGSGKRTVLLRNALHFAHDHESRAVGHGVTPGWRAQTQIVRSAALRADRIVVPCTAMAERVVFFLPKAKDRVVVRPHPVSTAAWASTGGRDQILVPVLAAPYKQMSMHVSRLLEATNGRDTRVVVTGTADEYSELVGHSRLDLVGRLSAEDLDHHWSLSAAIYFPTTLESFGYPLAQARANGRRVISPVTSQTAEIAGPALSGYDPSDISSLRSAVDDALVNGVLPDRATFNPLSYFDWLLDSHG